MSRTGRTTTLACGALTSLAICLGACDEGTEPGTSRSTASDSATSRTSDARAPIDPSEDAGPVYRDAWAVLQPHATAILFETAPATLASPEFREAVGRLVEATRMPHCTVEVVVNSPGARRLRDMGTFRRMAQLLDVAAKAREADGDLVAAAARHAAILRFALHLANGTETTVESMSVAAIARLGSSGLRDLAAAHDLPEDAKAEIDDVLALLDGDDPLRFGNSFRNELAGVTHEDVIAMSPERRQRLERVIDAWEKPDRVAALESIAGLTLEDVKSSRIPPDQVEFGVALTLAWAWRDILAELKEAQSG